MKQTKLWTKDFFIMFFTSFFIALVYFLLVTTMAVYAIQQFKASESMAGLAASIFVIGAVFARLKFLLSGLFNRSIILKTNYR